MVYECYNLFQVSKTFRLGLPQITGGSECSPFKSRHVQQMSRKFWNQAIPYYDNSKGDRPKSRAMRRAVRLGANAEQPGEVRR
jgi:hypothetical protein